MDEYAIDIPPDEVLGWVREDAGRTTPRLIVRASREYRVETDFDREAAGIGEDEDLALVTACSVMNVMPMRGRRGWVLQLRAEDSIGLRFVSDEETYEIDEDLPVDALMTEFSAAGNRGIEVMLSTDDGVAWKRFQRWLARRRARPAPGR